MAQFVLHVPDLEPSGKQYRFALPATWVQSVLVGSDVRADLAAGDGSLEVRADVTGKDVLVTGKLRSRLLTDCVRCLEDAGVDVDADLAILFSRGAATPPKSDAVEVDVDPDEPDREVFSGDDIALDDIVREHLILEVPMQPLCAADCAGIPIPEHVRPPPDFGQDAPDPRLEPLKQLAAKLQKNQE